MFGVHVEVCNQCGLHMEKIPVVPGTDMKEFHTPIEMQSIALNHEDDIAAFRKQAPDVEISSDVNDENYGVPIARSRKQKLQALAAAGFQEKN